MDPAASLTLQQLRAQMARIEAELRALRDRDAIRNLIAHYGPAVDRGDSKAAADLWEADGVYDLGPDWPRLAGRAAIIGVEEGPEHLGLIGGGAAHFLSSPAIELDGDTATAVCHSVVMRWTGAAFELYRVSANHFTLRRSKEDGWRIVERKNLLLQGSAAARALLTIRPPRA